MRMNSRISKAAIGLLFFALLLTGAAKHGAQSPVQSWKAAVVKDATPSVNRHVIHAYFNTTPESPDGRYVVYYTSAERDGMTGDIRILDRTTGVEEVIADNIHTEDSHRAACQQWISGGRRIAYHDYRDDEWIVAVFDMTTRKERVVARNRQLAWGSPAGDILPLYGPHWDANAYADLELLNVDTGTAKTVLTMDRVRNEYPAWFAKEYPGRRTSIFFPVLSPDASKVFFKLASPAGGDFRSREASARKGLVAYDIEKSELLFLHARWGHPAWTPDSQAIINVGPILIDVETGASRPIEGLRKYRGSHPSVSPDGATFATESGIGRSPKPGSTYEKYDVTVGDIKGHAEETVSTFDNSGGAKSWRPAHPHPTFSPDGNRLYFNVSSGNWTRLWVAERRP